MKYNLGFEIKGDLNLDIISSLILEKIKKKELIKIEKKFYFSQLSEGRDVGSCKELLSKEISRLKSLRSSRQELWRIYLRVDKLEDFMQKESYWLEIIYEKLGVIARPLTSEELRIP